MNSAFLAFQVLNPSHLNNYYTARSKDVRLFLRVVLERSIDFESVTTLQWPLDLSSMMQPDGRFLHF